MKAQEEIFNWINDITKENNRLEKLSLASCFLFIYNESTNLFPVLREIFLAP